MEYVVVETAYNVLALVPAVPGTGTSSNLYNQVVTCTAPVPIPYLRVGTSIYALFVWNSSTELGSLQPGWARGLRQRVRLSLSVSLRRSKCSRQQRTCFRVHRSYVWGSRRVNGNSCVRGDGGNVRADMTDRHHTLSVAPDAGHLQLWR